MARMRDIKEEARKRRKKLLDEFNKLPKGTTITEFAEMHGITHARMSKQLIMARKENK